MSDNRDGNMALLGFLVGAAVGAGVALLMAPAAGEDTRRHIGETAKRIRSTTSHRLGDLKDTMVERGKEAIHAGRDAYEREMDDSSREPV